MRAWFILIPPTRCCRSFRYVPPRYEVLQQYGVLMEGMLFKPAMIVPGAEAPKESPQKVAT